MAEVYPYFHAMAPLCKGSWHGGAVTKGLSENVLRATFPRAREALSIAEMYPRFPAMAPLCKGSWHGAAVTEGYAANYTRHTPFRPALRRATSPQGEALVRQIQ